MEFRANGTLLLIKYVNAGFELTSRLPALFTHTLNTCKHPYACHTILLNITSQNILIPNNIDRHPLSYAPFHCQIHSVQPKNHSLPQWDSPLPPPFFFTYFHRPTKSLNQNNNQPRDHFLLILDPLCKHISEVL